MNCQMGVFIEPQACYERRHGITPKFQPATPQPEHVIRNNTQPVLARTPTLSHSLEAIRSLVQEYGGDPLRITSVANIIARLEGKCSREALDERRKAVFKHVSALIKMGLLDRSNRNFVVLPADDCRYKAPTPRLGLIMEETSLA